jgi:hypothetical protein
MVCSWTLCNYKILAMILTKVYGLVYVSTRCHDSGIRKLAQKREPLLGPDFTQVGNGKKRI